MRYFTTQPISLFFLIAMLNFTSGCSKNLSQMELSLDHPADHNATPTQYQASINTLTSNHDDLLLQFQYLLESYFKKNGQF